MPDTTKLQSLINTLVEWYNFGSPEQRTVAKVLFEKHEIVLPELE